jgi:hypothetical protein
MNHKFEQQVAVRNHVNEGSVIVADFGGHEATQLNISSDLFENMHAIFLDHAELASLTHVLLRRCQQLKVITPQEVSLSSVTTRGLLQEAAKRLRAEGNDDYIEIECVEQHLKEDEELELDASREAWQEAHNFDNSTGTYGSRK